jgi:hypothetical protein
VADMTDEQFQALRKLILDQTVEIKALAIATRKLEARLVKIEAMIENGDMPTVYEATELDDLLKTRQSRAPHTDSE